MNQFVLPTAELLHSRGEAQTALHERAAQLTRSRFGQTVFVRAVVEISNFCRENCLYCGMRRSNRALKRFRAEHEQIADLLIHHRPESVTDVNIQAGEDPAATFYRVWSLASGRKRGAPTVLPPDRERAPRLSEPWFC